MPQITTAVILAFLTLTLSLSGCGDTSSKAVFSPDSGKHPDLWQVTHQAAAKTNLESCTECHGENLEGGLSQISCMGATAVSGFRCHAVNPVEPAGAAECISCHGGPPNGPFGNASPNGIGAHAKHTALLIQRGLTGTAICNTCHFNAGSGTANHARATAAGGFRPATVALPAALRAKTVTTTFGYANGQCSGVSCHGGKTTPAWSTTLGMAAGNNAVCLQCHEQGTAPATPQYNSFYSGIKAGRNLHSQHLNSITMTIYCTDCHNIGTLTDYQQHFGGILTNTFTAPMNTIGNSGSLLPTKIRTYTPATQTCGTVICHPDTSWNQP